MPLQTCCQRTKRLQQSEACNLLMPVLMQAGMTPPPCRAPPEPLQPAASAATNGSAFVNSSSPPTPAPITPRTNARRSPDVRPVAVETCWGRTPRQRQDKTDMSPEPPRPRLRAKSTAPEGFPTWYPEPEQSKPGPVTFHIPYLFPRANSQAPKG